MQLTDYAPYDRQLLESALRRGVTSASLLAKAKAINELNERSVPVPLDAIIAELEWIVQQAPIIGTERSYRAQSMATRLLAIVNDEWENPDKPAWHWERSTLADLELFLEQEMARAVGWHNIRWQFERDTPRVRWLAAEHAIIMASDDPFEAASEWCNHPPVDEARKIAPADRQPVVTVPDPEPLEDDDAA